MRTLRLGHRPAGVAVLLLLSAGCCVLSPVHQDPATVQSLNDLKPMIRSVYGSFKGATVDQTGIDQVKDKLNALKLREEGKGDCNSIMIGQVKKCREMFDGHVQNRLGGNAWSAGHYDNQLENMIDAIDLTLKTELNKSP